MTNDFYTLYDIDCSKLSRNFLAYPLKYAEKPLAEDLKYLYIEKNLFHKDVADYFNVNVRTLTKWLKHYNIKKPLDKVRSNINKTNIEKYGVEHSFQSSIFKDKRKESCKEKYGCDYYVQSNDFKSKSKESCKEKFGTEFFQQKHLSKESLEILNDRELLKNFISNQSIKTFTSIANELGIHRTNLRLYVLKHNLIDMIDYDYNESSYEQELQKLYPSLIKHNRNILDGSEIDLFDVHSKVGIEFNGDFWHNEFGKEKNYHQDKSLLAESKGIFIYHIFEYEWKTKKQQIINQLNNLLGLNQDKIYARKCVIREVDNKSKRQFLKMNHMQGNDSSSIKLGLYYKDELVSLMTFCKPRFNKNYEYELSRFCSKANCNVIGGASKLWNYFIKTYNPKTVISYSNISHTRGNLYGNLGFILQGISEPNYVWANHNDVLSRYQCQKHKLKGYDNKSESEIMHSLGYYKIYDCGNKVWVWNC